MILKAPFRLPPGFLPAFGYRGQRQFVALYWEPSGDEACYDDGIHYACGLCDNWLYLAFIRQPHVMQWRDENDLRLGNSEEAAQHWLIVDILTSDIYVAPVQVASRIVRLQGIPPDELL